MALLDELQHAASSEHEPVVLELVAPPAPTVVLPLTGSNVPPGQMPARVEAATPVVYRKNV